MSATLFALALFGCSDDGTACQRLSTPVQTYETQRWVPTPPCAQMRRRCSRSA